MFGSSFSTQQSKVLGSYNEEDVGENEFQWDADEQPPRQRTLEELLAADPDDDLCDHANGRGEHTDDGNPGGGDTGDPNGQQGEGHPGSDEDEFETDTQSDYGDDDSRGHERYSDTEGEEPLGGHQENSEGGQEEAEAASAKQSMPTHAPQSSPGQPGAGEEGEDPKSEDEWEDHQEGLVHGMDGGMEEPDGALEEAEPPTNHNGGRCAGGPPRDPPTAATGLGCRTPSLASGGAASGPGGYSSTPTGPPRQEPTLDWSTFCTLRVGPRTMLQCTFCETLIVGSKHWRNHFASCPRAPPQNIMLGVSPAATAEGGPPTLVTPKQLHRPAPPDLNHRTSARLLRPLPPPCPDAFLNPFQILGANPSNDQVMTAFKQHNALLNDEIKNINERLEEMKTAESRINLDKGKLQKCLVVLDGDIKLLLRQKRELAFQLQVAKGKPPEVVREHNRQMRAAMERKKRSEKFRAMRAKQAKQERVRKYEKQAFLLNNSRYQQFNPYCRNMITQRQTIPTSAVRPTIPAAASAHPDDFVTYFEVGSNTPSYCRRADVPPGCIIAGE